MAPFFPKNTDVRLGRHDAPRGGRHDAPRGASGYDRPRRDDGPRRNDKYNDGSRARYESSRKDDAPRRDDAPSGGRHDGPRNDASRRNDRAGPRDDAGFAPRGNDRAGPRGDGGYATRGNDRSGPRGNDRAAPRGSDRPHRDDGPRGRNDARSSDRPGPRKSDRPAPRSSDRAGPRNDRPAPRSDRPGPRSNDREGGRFGAPARNERPAPKPRREEEELERPEGLSASGEMKYHGFNACEALWKNRAIDIIRVYVAEERLADFGPLLKWCARQKKAYHVCSPGDLEKIAATVHHEGVVILAHAPKPLGDDDFDSRIAALSGATPLVYLDGVQNPHNVGSITRLAAHFGVPLILGKDKELPRLSPSAVRVAEGAAEHVPLLVLKDPDLAFSKLKKKGYKIVVTSSHAPTSLYATKLPEKVLFVFGGESAGASPRVTKLADLQVNVPGTGTVESLNVSVAAGLFLGEFWRAHKV